MQKEEPSIVYMYRGSSRTIPWGEIRRVIAAQLGRDAELALTITCQAVDKASFVEKKVEGPPTAEISVPRSIRKRSTMLDVAREANVSISTVSRVLNDHCSIGVETQKRVEDAMKRLDYRPNEAARAMVRSKRIDEGATPRID